MQKNIVMLSTSGKGGMLSVVEGYRRDGLFERWNIRFIASHRDGSLPGKLHCAIHAFFHVLLLAAQGRISVLHCHVSMYGSFWRKAVYASLGRAFGIEVVLHMHGGDLKLFHDALPAFAQRLVSHQLAAATAVLVLSEYWRDYILQLAPAARVLVLPNYVDIPAPATMKTAPADGRINLLYLGKIEERKGTYDLLLAFAAALQRFPGLHLRIGGNGEVEEAQAFARKLGVQAQVDILGWVDAQQKAALLAGTDVYVLPSYAEGLPVSVLEAMACGIPVVTTPVGAIPEFIEDGVNGFLAAPGDVEALQDLMVRLAGDNALRGAAGAAGRGAVQKRFSRDSVLPTLESLYAECAKAAEYAAPRR